MASMVPSASTRARTHVGAAGAIYEMSPALPSVASNGVLETSSRTFRCASRTDANGETLEYRIVGINHDDLVDGSGKAGLTFLITSRGIYSRENAMDTSIGGWKKSELREKMNSGEIWNLMPSDFRSKVKPVRKLTNNVCGDSVNKDAAVTATSDKLFLVSYSEIVATSYWADSDPWTSSEDTQYETFKGKVTNNFSADACLAIGIEWWQRSVPPGVSEGFLGVYLDCDMSLAEAATRWCCVCPAWCF